MQLDIIAAALYLLGKFGICAALMDTADEILIHFVIDCAHIRDGFAADHALDIAVPYRIGGFRRQTAFNGSARAKPHKTGSADNRLQNGIAAGDSYAVAYLTGAFHCALIIQASLPHHAQHGRFCHIGLVAVAQGFRLSVCVVSVFVMLKLNIAARQLFTRHTVMQHQTVLEKECGRNDRKAADGI